MAEPKVLDEVMGEAFAKLRAAQDSPAGRAHMEHAARLAEARRLRDLRELAEIRGVIADADVRAFAFDPHLSGYFPEAVRRATAWRRERMRAARGEHVPVVVFLSGPPGLGKSVALCHRVVQAERSAWYVTAAELATTVRNGHSDPEARWRRWERCDVLAVDEAGLEANPEALTGLLLARWSNGGETYVGTNLARRDVAARYFDGANGPRLVDRLTLQQRRGLAWCVTATGKSLRTVAT